MVPVGPSIDDTLNNLLLVDMDFVPSSGVSACVSSTPVQGSPLDKAVLPPVKARVLPPSPAPVLGMQVFPRSPKVITSCYVSGLGAIWGQVDGTDL